MGLPLCLDQMLFTASAGLKRVFCLFVFFVFVDPQGMKELKKQVESLPPVNYNLLKYICRYSRLVCSEYTQKLFEEKKASSFVTIKNCIQQICHLFAIL